MYYPPDDPTPWYKDYNVIFILFIITILAYGYLTGQIKPECLREVCNG
jgi:p-aminobenzoyl-glutamate transporter AbgT